jgi:hypothetical protein
MVCKRFAVVFAVLACGLAQAQSPRVGDVQRLTAVTVSLRVGSTEKETRRVVYTPPPGWHVRSHDVQVKARYGSSSFSVNTVPRDWRWSSQESLNESDRLHIDVAGQAQHVGVHTALKSEKDRVSSELREVRATHHALVVEATAKGEGFLRGGGGVELTVTAEIVFLGTGTTSR